jgi:hypothetical protein
MFRESYLKCRYIGHFWYTSWYTFATNNFDEFDIDCLEYGNFDRPFH